MHELGISVYPEKENLEETYHYMALAAHYGYTRIFTCLLSVDESKEKIMKDFKAFMDKAHELDFKVAVYTNQRVFKHLGANYDDLSPFKEMGVDIIRLDESFGFDGDVTAVVKDRFVSGESNLLGDIANGEGSGNCINCASDCTNKEHYAHDDAENKRECTFQNSHSLLLKSKRTLSCERAPRVNVL